MSVGGGYSFSSPNRISSDIGAVNPSKLSGKEEEIGLKGSKEVEERTSSLFTEVIELEEEIEEELPPLEMSVAVVNSDGTQTVGANKRANLSKMEKFATKQAFGSESETRQLGWKDISSEKLVKMFANLEGKEFDYEVLRLNTRNGNELQGYFIGSSVSGGASSLSGPKVAVFFGGSHGPAENYYFPSMHDMLTSKGYDVLIVNYPGFGQSTGEPGVEGLQETADTCYNFLKERGVKDEKIVAYGYSVGSYPATYFAEQHERTNLVLDAPFGGLRNESIRKVDEEFGKVFPRMSKIPIMKRAAHKISKRAIERFTPNSFAAANVIETLESAVGKNPNRVFTHVSRQRDDMSLAYERDIQEIGEGFRTMQTIMPDIDHFGKDREGKYYALNEFKERFSPFELI